MSPRLFPFQRPRMYHYRCCGLSSCSSSTFPTLVVCMNVAHCVSRNDTLATGSSSMVYSVALDCFLAVRAAVNSSEPCTLHELSTFMHARRQSNSARHQRRGCSTGSVSFSASATSSTHSPAAPSHRTLFDDVLRSSARVFHYARCVF